ncbi:MAG: endonuclease MutS2, partial [Bacteroidota bacterium]
MRTYPKDIESKLGFDEIRELLSKYCQSEKGNALLQKAKPTDSFQTLTRWLNQVKEMIRVKSEGNGKVAFEFVDIDEYLTKLKVDGSFIDPSDFHELKRGVTSIYSWIAFFSVTGDEYPNLKSLASSIELDQNLVIEIDRAIDERGEVKDSASTELSSIRTKISKSERSVRSAIQKVLKKAKENDLTEKDSSLTVRDGRLVIPLKAEHKKRIPGFVHDESATGQTVYLEPGEVLELNNEVRELKYQEKREIVRILISLANLVRSNMPGLIAGSGLLEKLDFIHAKVLLSEMISATIPKVEKGTSFNLINATHPLLFLSHKESGKGVVPLNLFLDSERRILIISGPNAGGKSVA